MSQDKQVYIIGAGASGMMAAICAAQNGACVTVLERMPKAGTKLSITGNGACNLTTLDPAFAGKYHSSAGDEHARAFAQTVFSWMDPAAAMAFFRSIGVPCRAKGDYVYPLSEQASSVASALQEEARRLGVRIRTNTPARRIRRENGRWEIETDGYAYKADAVILACGSKAAARTGSDGSGYKLAAQAGHSCTLIQPALAGICLSGDAFRSAAGARSIARVSAHIFDGRDENVISDEGQVQWTKDGISGVVVMQLSGRIACALAQHRQVHVVLDLVPEMDRDALRTYLRELYLHREVQGISVARAKKPLRESPTSAEKLYPLLSPFVNERLLPVIRSQVQASLKNTNDAFSGSQEPGAAIAEAAADALKALTFTVSGVRDFDQAQVCSGGIPLDEIDPADMQSRLADGLYFAGEIVDIDGPCGGYNLQWAWSSGYAAGTAAARAALSGTCAR